ncbi:MAG TPA: sulfatase-like hydrolase/transferase [Thermoanaerobaculia bacterium]|nr:sulfatase-like hydrolase/transferase [Thermoanaerobaculia bacterium]
MPSPSSGAPRHTLRAAGLGAPLAAILLLACAADEVSPPAGQPASPSAPLTDLLPLGSGAGHNLLLITLDTTRADHLGAYGAEGSGTPNLDRLARRGIRFADAVSPVPMTLPAHATLMTGLDPPGHGVRVNGEAALAPEHVTLAEVLNGAGYRTAAFVSSFVLDPRFGLDQGFHTYDARLEATRAAAFGHQTERSAGAVTRAALAWLRAYRADGTGQDAPFFLWVHYFDPHDPYEPPEPFARRFRARPYAGEIAYVDQEVGRLLSAIDAEGMTDHTVVLAVADHGESLGEHGERYHSRSLYEDAVRVPLILAVPALPDDARGVAIDGFVVTLADLYPSLLELLDLSDRPELRGPEGPAPLDGRSLLKGPFPPDRSVYLETLNPYLDNGWAPLFAARSHREKYVEAPRPEYYDLGTDPGEMSNLLEGGGAAPAARVLELQAFVRERGTAQTDLNTLAARAEAMAPAARRSLEALGYLGGGGPASGRAPEELPDPKDMLPLLDTLAEGRRLLAAGEPLEAARKARLLVSRSPNDRAALQLLGEALAAMGREEEAERALRSLLDVGPTVGASVLLAQVVMQQGRFDEAALLLDQAADLDPRHGAVALARGDLRLFQGQPEEALALYREAWEMDPYRFEGLARARIARLEERVGVRRR